METPTLYGAIGAIIAALGVFMTTRHFDIRRIEEFRQRCEERCLRGLGDCQKALTKLSASVAMHHQDGKIHRDREREDAQFKRIEHKIDANKEAVITQQRTVEERIDDLQTLMENIHREIRNNNGKK